MTQHVQFVAIIRIKQCLSYYDYILILYTCTCNKCWCPKAAGHVSLPDPCVLISPKVY